MPRDDEPFDFDLPFGRVQFSGWRRMRFGHDDEEGVIEMEEKDSDYFEYREVRRSVRKRLRFFRHAFTYLALNGLFLLLDATTGGDGPADLSWSLWVALIWGIFLAWESVSSFVAPYLWGREMEERLVRRELRRRRGGA
jgi:hypothetical protein